MRGMKRLVRADAERMSVVRKALQRLLNAGIHPGEVMGMLVTLHESRNQSRLLNEVKILRGDNTGPEDIDGYLAEGWALMKKGQFEASVAILEEGLSHNPNAFQLHYLVGQVHFNQARQHTTGVLSLDQPEIVPWLRSAQAAYAKGAAIGLAAWEESNDVEWTSYLDTDLRGAVRMDAMMEYRFGNPSEAIRKAERALTLLNGDPILQRNLDAWQAK